MSILEAMGVLARGECQRAAPAEEREFNGPAGKERTGYAGDREDDLVAVGGVVCRVVELRALGCE